MKNWVFLLLIIAISMMFIVVRCSSKKVTNTLPSDQESAKPATQISVMEKNDKPDILESGSVEQSTLPADLSFRDVNFDYDKYDLLPRSREILSEHARVLKENSNVKVLIEGHCDERGTIEYNLALGERRANAVKSYLINYGIEQNRMSTISYGKERPLDPANTPEAWAKNRRAAFIIK